MIELPESLIIARQLNETVKGKRIEQADAGHTPHGFAFYEGNPADYAAKMAGIQVGESKGIGSMVQMQLGEYMFIIGDGTNMRYFPPGSRIPEKYQTKIIFEDGSALICTVQMYGSMFLVRPEEYDNFYYKAALEKPMPCTDEFDFEYFLSLRESCAATLSIKAFLATEQRIPGLGNGSLQDILLECGFHPKHKISGLRQPDWKAVYDGVVGVLDKMTRADGRDTEKTLFGEPGRYVTKLSKKTLDKPCMYCGNSIRKISYLGGTVYFCNECQRL